MTRSSSRWLTALMLAATSLAAQAVPVDFRPVADGVYGHIGDDGTDVSAAVRTFDTKPFMRLHNAAELMPGNGSRAYLELERE